MTDGNEMQAALERVQKENPTQEDDGLRRFDWKEKKVDKRGEPVIDEDGNEIIISEFTFEAQDPTEGQLVFLMSAMGRGQTGAQRVASVVNFLNAVLEPSSADYLAMRLLDRDAPLPDEAIEEIFRAFAEDWFGRPTN